MIICFFLSAFCYAKVPKLSVLDAPKIIPFLGLRAEHSAETGEYTLRVGQKTVVIRFAHGRFEMGGSGPEIVMSSRFVPKKPVSSDYIDNFLWSSNAKFAKARVHLTGEIEVEASVPLVDTTFRAVRSAVAQQAMLFFALDLELPSSKDKQQGQINLDQVVTALDGEDLDDLTKAWGWQSNRGFGFSGPVMPVLADANGVTFWLSNAHPGQLLRDVIVARADGQTVAKGVDVRAVEKRLPGLEVQTYEHWTHLTYTIKLEGGVKLKKLKANLQEYMRIVKSLLISQ